MAVEKTIHLNDSQWQAVKHNSGPMMVLAGPGSGKTTVITCRVLYMIRRYKIPPEKILVLTFSKSAADEMQKRFLTLANIPGVTFGTFHAVFYRILRAWHNYALQQVLQEDERRQVIKKILNDMHFALDDDFLAAVLNEMTLVKNELFDLAYYNSAAIGADAFRQLFTTYEAYKQRENKIDFDDMLTLCHTLFTTDARCLAYWQRRYPYIMIDEFQDINHVQYACMQLLSAPAHHLFIVGDDDQSIYRFRGSRPEFLLRFPQDFPDVKRTVLDINYRSTDAIIRFSNQIITKNKTRYPKVIVGTHKSGVPPVFLTAEDPNKEAAAIAARIKEWAKKGTDLNEIAVIYRVNLQSRAFTDAFMHMHIPYRVKDEMPNIYEHWLAQDLHAYLRLNENRAQGFDIYAERIINKPFRYIGKAFITGARTANKHIFDAYATTPLLERKQKRLIELLQQQVKSIAKRSPSAAIAYIRKAVGYDEYLKAFCQFRKMSATGLFEIADELQDAADPFVSIADYLSHVEEVIAVSKEKKYKKGQSEAPGVTLTTMHSAKGLEYDTVFIAGAVEGVMPHERSKTDAEIEEERRLFYVGVTRARQTLYISVPRTRYGKPVKPTRFIVQGEDAEDEKKITKT